MTDSILLLPLLIIFAAAGFAGLAGLPALNRRVDITRLSWLLALAPLAAFVLLVLRVPSLSSGHVMHWQFDWLPALNLRLSLYFDHLSALFALLITLIGALVVVYTGQYFKGDRGAWRFLAYIFLFMGSMLGLVIAGDVITLFIFWEGTSVTSFLLVAYKTGDDQARRGAFKALFITGGGGIALLGGLLLLASVAGGTDFATVLASGDVLRNSELYGAILALVAFGAFTKSAQFPAHIWLPSAMSAPTPASAFLHSATMVKAGIYLLARFNVALGATESWFWLLTITGMATMLVGAFLALKQSDLKALLAYSTVSVLGILVMLIGQADSSAYKALVIGIMAHALYKSALFLAAGIVDHETGTRDIGRLGGLARAMPATMVVTALAALSMAGLPPLVGFLAKETLLAASLHPGLPPLVAQVFTISTVIAGALLLASAGLLVYETFLGRPKDPSLRGHDPPRPMWLAAAVPALLSLVLTELPGFRGEAEFLAGAATRAFGQPVKVSLAFWHGLNVPLLLSIVAVSLGSLIFFWRWPIRALQDRLPRDLSFDGLYRLVLALIDSAAGLSIRLQTGRLRHYLVVVVAGTFLLVAGLSGTTLLPSQAGLQVVGVDFRTEVLVLRTFVLLMVVAASLASVVLTRDLFAILALGAAGLSVAMLFVLEPAPDVALVQIVVDILAVVILVLALTRLPRAQRRKAQELSSRAGSDRWGLARDAVVSGLAGLVVAAITLAALLSRPRLSQVTPFYEANAKAATGALDIVGAIVVDFRALDTLLEIAVFGMAGLGIYTLLRYAARTHGDVEGQLDELAPPEAGARLTLGIGGVPTSPFIRLPAMVTLPLAMVLAAVHMMFGHDQPGDGFTAGVIVSLAIGLWFVVLGYEDTRARLRWLKPSVFIGAGLLLALVNGLVQWRLAGAFLANVDYGKLIGLSLPGTFHISSSFLFEVAIFLTVLGSAAYMLSTLGHPGYRDQESMRDLQEIAQRET